MFVIFFFFSFLGTNLVKKAIYAMVEGDCDEVSGKGLFPLEDCIWSPLFLCRSLEVISFSSKSEKFINMVPTRMGQL